MKLTIRSFTILVCTFFCMASHAQVGEMRNDFAIGANGGFLMNRVSFDPTIRQSFKSGMMLGFTARYVCERYLGMVCAIQAEVNYAQMGWKEDIQESPDEYLRNVNYIQIPLLANVGFGREVKGVKGYLVLGPQLGFYMSDKAKKNEWENEDNPKRPNNIVAQYSLPIQKKFEYGLTGGLGMEISGRKFGHIMIEGRYYYGLSDMFKNGKTDAFGRSANGAIVAKLTYLFDVVKTQGIKRK